MHNLLINRDGVGKCSCTFLLLFFLILISPLSAFSESQDSIPDESVVLDEIVVEGQGESITHKKSNSLIVMSPGQLMTGARVFGESDILIALRKEANVTIAGDYGSGLAVDGADPYQSVCRIDGAPVYFPYRFGGIFSTFNSSHFGSVKLYRHTVPTDAPKRLGALIDFYPVNPIGKPVYAMGNLGIISSSAAFRGSVADKFGLSFAGRISYLNRVYGRWLKSDEYELSYDFGDLNVSAFFKPDRVSLLRASFFMNSDQLGMSEKIFELDMKLKWRNRVASLNYDRSLANGDLSLDAWYSDYSSNMMLDIPSLSTEIGSGIKSVGLNGIFRWNLMHRFLRTVVFSLNSTFYHLTPQYVEVERGDAFTDSDKVRQYPIDVNMGVSALIDLPWQFNLDVALNGYAYFFPQSYHSVSLLPGVTLRRDFNGNLVSVSAMLTTQSLHQSGFSEIGMASNYWTAADSRFPVERSVRLIGGWSKFIYGPGLDLSVDIYYSANRNQTVYSDGLMALLDIDYDPLSTLRLCRGWNAGITSEVRKEFGNVTGQVSAGWSISRRRFYDSTVYWPGNFDGGFKMNAAAQWRPRKHWEFGANFIFSQGRVYTPVLSMYIIAGNVASEFGTRNSSRLSPYHRLDLSATYILQSRKGRLRHLFNLSLLNAYGHKNVEMQYVRVKLKNGRFFKKKIYSLYRFLPSVSYTLELK